MKKFFVMGLGLSAVFAMTSCKSSESAYKKAYEKAKQQQVVATEQEPTQTQTTTQVEVTPVTPSTTTSTATNADVNTVRVQSENVTVVSGNGLKAYSVVCGSFSLKAMLKVCRRHCRMRVIMRRLHTTKQRTCIVWWLLLTMTRLLPCSRVIRCAALIPTHGCFCLNDRFRIIYSLYDTRERVFICSRVSYREVCFDY